MPAPLAGEQVWAGQCGHQVCFTDTKDAARVFAQIRTLQRATGRTPLPGEYVSKCNFNREAEQNQMNDGFYETDLLSPADRHAGPTDPSSRAGSWT